MKNLGILLMFLGGIFLLGDDPLFELSLTELLAVKLVAGIIFLMGMFFFSHAEKRKTLVNYCRVNNRRL
jgi:hypothetical protein